MKVSLSWLKKLVDINTPIDDLTESLSIAGFEVEEIEDLSQNIQGVIIGLIKEITPHPNADKLKICQVKFGKKEYKQIVCGAPNVRKDIHVLVAPIGTYLPSIDLKIKKSEIRGIESHGMICSYKELGLSNQSDGIAILEDDKYEIPELGESPKEILGLDDIILELAITANRPDGMSMIGIAREISALMKLRLKYNHYSELTDYKLFNPLNNKQDAIKTDGVYSLHFIDGLNGKIDSPRWLKNRINNAGINSINAIVDITNYVMLETGQPLHAFDADELNKITKKTVIADDFEIRKAKANEVFHALDDKKYKLNDKCHLITCNGIPIAVPGLIGSYQGSVKATTKKIWLEAALFTPTAIRICSREMGLRTESSSRYEKGISSHITLFSAKRAIDLYHQIFNVDLKGNWISNLIKKESNFIALRRQRIHKMLGKIKSTDKSIINQKDLSNSVKLSEDQKNRNISDEEIKNILTLLGCTVVENKDGWNINVPHYRSSDLTREIDLIEEIARLIGYDNFESKLPNPIKPGGLNPIQISERKLRTYLNNSGLQEITTFSLVNKKEDSPKQIAIANPLLKETSHLRTNIWEEHLSICKRNQDAGSNACWFYEIGKSYQELDSEFCELSLISGVITGNKSNERWSEKSKNKSINYYEARGLLENTLKALKLTTEDNKISNINHLHPGKSAEIYLEGKSCGLFGQIHPSLASKYEINKETYLFELKLDNILHAATRSNKWNVNYKEYATVPSMDRDISIWVTSDTSTNDLIKAIRKTGKAYLENVYLIDRYDNDQDKTNKISLTFRLIYRKKDSTLTDHEVTPVHNKILNFLEQNFNIELRC